MSHFFQFETDFVDSLRCIPMIVRFKLDTSGIKLKLEAWNQMPSEERQMLIDLPCDKPNEISNYRSYLCEKIKQHTHVNAIDLPVDVAPAWLNSTQVPSVVSAKASALGHEITLPQWQALTALQRFALIKLSRSSHENLNFLPALQEFGLI